jgi:hypothetical protein
MYDGAVCSWIRTGACFCFASVQQSLICLTPGELRAASPSQGPTQSSLCVRAHLMRDPKSALTSSVWCHEPLVWFCVEQDCMIFHVLHVLQSLKLSSSLSFFLCLV